METKKPKVTISQIKAAITRYEDLIDESESKLAKYREENSILRAAYIQRKFKIKIGDEVFYTGDQTWKGQKYRISKIGWQGFDSKPIVCAYPLINYRPKVERNLLTHWKK